MASATLTSTMESDSPITVIVDSLRDQTIAFTTPKTAPLSSVYETLYTRAPWIQNSTYILTTNSRRLVSHGSTPVSSLLSSSTDTFLPLRLTVPLCGGKGGFGSILRAQGGRMSKNKKNGQDQHGSSRNLDGRRLRTVNEAKVLAEYLAIKPDMEKKEKEERKKRWEDIVASTERKQQELISGKGVRLDGKWVEDKEEAESKTREAVEAMLMAQIREDEEMVQAEMAEAVEAETKASSSKSAAPKAMFGWDDEDDEFMSDSEDDTEDTEVSEEDVKVEYEGKGKGKVVEV